MLKEIKLQELKELQLKILIDVDRFCRANGINYWITCGTLLGAIRHKGYIPWDDDIDIGMLRSDYERFMYSYNNSGDGNYKFVSVETDSDYFSPFGKVLDTKTVLYEPNKKGYKISVYIDVFVYDNAPDDDAEVALMYRKRDFLNKLNNTRTNHHRKTESVFKEFAVLIGRPLLFLFPKQFFVKRMIKNSSKYAGAITKRVGNFTSMTAMTCDRDVFSEFVDVSFEGFQFMAPIGYDKWLKSFYGDYMKLPPIEKQISHHEFEAYWL